MEVRGGSSPPPRLPSNFDPEFRPFSNISHFFFSPLPHLLSIDSQISRSISQHSLLNGLGLVDTQKSAASGRLPSARSLLPSRVSISPSTCLVTGSTYHILVIFKLRSRLDRPTPLSNQPEVDGRRFKPPKLLTPQQPTMRPIRPALP